MRYLEPAAAGVPQPVGSARLCGNASGKRPAREPLSPQVRLPVALLLR